MKHHVRALAFCLAFCLMLFGCSAGPAAPSPTPQEPMEEGALPVRSEEEPAPLPEEEEDAPHEAQSLRIRSEKLNQLFPDLPRCSLSVAVQKTVEWEKARLAGKEMAEVTDEQIDAYFAGEWRA